MRKTSWIVTRAAAATVVAAWGTHAAAQSIVDKAALLDGNWSTQDIWDDVGFPPPREPDNTAVGDGEAYNAIIAAPGGRTVTITDAGENAIRVDAGTGSDGSSGTLVMTGGTLTISNPDPIAGGLPSLRVGVTPGSSGLFTMSGGTVSILGAPNSGFADGDFMVGDQGIGVANLSGGTVTASDEVLIGVFGTGTVTVSGTATLANNVAAGSVARGIIVGTESGSNGRLNIRDSATVTTRANLDIGRRRNNVTNVRSTGFIDMTGGTINVGTPTTAGADFTVGFESDGRFDVSGASVVNIVDNLVLGIIASTVPSPAASGIVNHGGTATVNVDEILVGENGIGTYNMTGGTINGRNTLHVALNGVSTGTFNQSAGTITVPRLDAGERGAGTYNMNGGTLNVATTAAGNLRIGQDGGGANVGVGTFNHTAGTVSVGSGALASHIFLGDFDDSTGTYKISGGVLNVSGNVNVGAALASNAAPDATRTGTGGQALNAVGTFIVSGSAGDINVAGDFLANAGDKNRPGTPNQSHLGFEIFDATGTSLIEVASAADLDGAVVNMSLMGGYTPAPDTVFNLLSAGAGIGGDTGTGTTKINGSTGEAFSLAAGDATDWTLRVVPGLLAGSEFLQAVFQLTNVPRTLYWDVDGTTPGGGGATPAGDWNGSAANFNTDATGGAGGTTTGATTDLDTVVFAAGADGGGTYAVNLTGTRTAAEVQVARGNVTLAGGTLATGSFDVAAGASGTVSSLVSGNAAGAVTKKGAGVLTLAANNTYTGGTNVQAGTLRVTRLHENNPVNITGGKLQVMDSSPTLPSHPSGDNAFVSRPSSLTIANNGAPLGTRTYAGQLDLGNNDLIIDYSGATPFADIQDMIRAGYNGGTWLGNGIASSTAAANSNFALGIAENSQLTIPFSASRLFSGQAVDTTTILVKFTHRIDLDLDGVITTNDATIFNSNYSEGAPAYWSIGDLDYDKVFTTNDATLFNSFYNEALASVPEPATLGVLGVGALGLLRRQRRGA